LQYYGAPPQVAYGAGPGPTTEVIINTSGPAKIPPPSTPYYPPPQPAAYPPPPAAVATYPDPYAAGANPPSYVPASAPAVLPPAAVAAGLRPNPAAIGLCHIVFFIHPLENKFISWAEQCYVVIDFDMINYVGPSSHHQQFSIRALREHVMGNGIMYG